MSLTLAILGVVILVIGAGIAIAGLGGVAIGITEDEPSWWKLGIVGLVAPAILFGGFKTHLAGIRGLEEQSCESFGRQTNYITRVIITTSIDTGTCYVDFAGSWVPRDQLWAEMSGELRGDR